MARQGGASLLAGQPSVLPQACEFLSDYLATIALLPVHNGQQDASPSYLKELLRGLAVTPEIQSSNPLILKLDDDEEFVFGDFLKLKAQAVFAAACHSF
ncbi:hypothetical protein ABZT49_09955 [Methylobacterium sp. EM32]|uniref:hypothetical protein n=1 Tax=Methylobacterium sp. EM32 TaxID=3163481 RepID=UPI0033A087AB